MLLVDRNSDREFFGKLCHNDPQPNRIAPVATPNVAPARHNRLRRTSG